MDKTKRRLLGSNLQLDCSFPAEKPDWMLGRCTFGHFFSFLCHHITYCIKIVAGYKPKRTEIGL